MKAEKEKLKPAEIVLFCCAGVCVAALLVTAAFQMKGIYTLRQFADTAASTAADKTFVLLTASTAAPEETQLPTLAETQAPTQATVSAFASTAPRTAQVQGTAKKIEATTPSTTDEPATELDSTLILNVKTKKIHSTACSYVGNMNDENKKQVSGDTLQSYLDSGYTVCSRCKACKPVQ